MWIYSISDFDTVEHPVFISELASLDIQDPLLKWLSDFLDEYKQWVSLDGVLSSDLSLKPGVGFVIGVSGLGFKSPEFKPCWLLN